MLDKFLEAMDDEREYDFIANYFHMMGKNDVKSILLEYIYAIHTMGKDVEEEIREAVRDELQSREVFGE